MADPGDRLTALRRLDSQDKTHRVLAALDTVIEGRQPLTIAALARRAGVSRRFLYDHPELRAEAERRSAQAADRQAGTMTASARVTMASLRADLANAKAVNHRLTIDLAALRRRLGQSLGRDALADLDHAAIDPGADLARTAHLEQSLFEAGEELTRATEELDASRQINRELTASLNRERH
jgi:hypothetical protein